MTTDYDLLLDRIEQNAVKDPSKKAVTFLGSGPDGGKIENTLTYSELIRAMTAVANRLNQEKLKPGDCAVLVYPPSLDYMIAFLACLKAGVVAVPVFPPNPSRRDTLHMFSSIVKSSGASFALTSVSYNHLKKLAGIKDVVARFNRPTAAWPENLKWIATNDGKRPGPEASFATPKPTDLAFLQFTSGSTSEPKGVMITHKNLAHNLTIITNELKAVEDTVVVSWLPQYHDMGLIGSYLGCLYCGGSGYYMSPLSFLQRPVLWIEAVSKYKATHVQAPNFAFKLVARKFTSTTSTNLDLSSLRHVINAAEPVTEDAINAFVERFGKYGFRESVMYPTYGLAEHTVFCCSGGKQRLTVDKQELETNGKVVQKEGSDGTSRLIGCGYPAHQGVDVRIVNRETRTQFDEDTVGEIWIQSDSKAAGYYNKSHETKEDFQATLEGGNDGDGYLRTGDLGFFHNQELFICGRLKDLIIVGGRNYYPQDIEATAEATNFALRPGCSAAFTIDPTAHDGEEVALVMELREVLPNMDLCDSIVESVRSAITQEHSLNLAEIVLLKPKSVPKTSSGKIARSWCRKAYVANNLEAVYRKELNTNKVSSLEIDQTPARTMDQKDIEKLRGMNKKEILAKLQGEVAKMTGSASSDITPDVPLATILDSLSVSQLKGQLEAQYAVKLSDEYLFRENCTLNKLVEVVRLGYAPDDGEGIGAAPILEQEKGGLAQSLGCPPGVYCVIL